MSSNKNTIYASPASNTQQSSEKIPYCDFNDEHSTTAGDFHRPSAASFIIQKNIVFCKLKHRTAHIYQAVSFLFVLLSI